MDPVVDIDTCIGCGNCMEICPSVFQVIDENPPGGVILVGEFFECCEAAEENCPVEAITLKEE